MRKSSFTILLTICAVLALVVSSQTAAQSEEISEAQALSVVRALNTKELEFFIKEHAYVPLERAAQNVRLQDSSIGSIVLTDQTSGRIRNYTASLLTSADQKHYRLSLIAESPGCSTAFFTDESGVIYLGKVIDCTAGVRGQ
jgi:hypothetical protein